VSRLPCHRAHTMHARSAYDEVVEVSRYLLTAIGRRQATSLAEAQAAAYVDGRLRRAGMRVNADTFQAPINMGLLYPLLALLALGTGLLAHWLPLPASLFALWLLLVALSDGLIPLPPLLTIRRDCQNIIGTRASEQRPRWRVVLLAPLDSAPDRTIRNSWIAGQRMAVLGRSIALGLLALLASLHAIRPHENWSYAQALPLSYLLVTHLLLPVRIGTAPGGAGALAVLLAAAERLNALRTVELWTIALGATATGNTGLYNLLQRYPFPRSETLFLNLESLDRGQLTYAAREGVLHVRRADPLLIRLAATIGAADPQINVEPRSYHTAPSIAAPLQRQGYRVLTFLTYVPADTDLALDTPLAQIDPQVLEQATRLVVSIVQHLDTEPLTRLTPALSGRPARKRAGFA